MVASTTLVSISRFSGPPAPAIGLALLLMLPAWRGTAAPGASFDVIPRPTQVNPQSGVFAVGSTLALVVPASDREEEAAAQGLKELLAIGEPALLKLTVQTGAEHDGALVLRRLNESSLGPEGYRLTVTPQRIVLAANGPAGWLYGGVTLWQLVHTGTGAGSARVVDAQVI